MKKRSIFTLVAALLLSTTIYAQKTIQEWADMDDKQFSKGFQYLNTLVHLKTSVNKGWIPADEVKVPQRIGLLSYSLIQPTATEKTAYSIYTPYLTDAGTGYVLDALAVPAQTGVTSAFKSKGLEVLTPDRYCNTPEKKKLFEETEFEMSGLLKFAAKLAENIRSRQGVDDPKGYVGKFIVVPSDPKVYRAVGAFTKQMDLDGMILIEQTVNFDGKVLTLGIGTISLIGANPTPESEKVSYAPIGPLKGYIEGFVYGSVTYTPKPFVLATFKKKDMKWNDINGLETVNRRIAEDLLDYIAKEVEKAKK